MALAEFVAENPWTLLVFLSTFILLLVFLKDRTRTGFNIPKGPVPFPFFGNALTLKGHDAFLEQLMAWGMEYGSLFSLYIGRKLVVVVNGIEAVKELTLKTGLDFADRPEITSFILFNPSRLGIFESRADEKWKRQRKFAHTTLRGMGFGKVSLEPLIQKEARHLINYFKTKRGSLLDPSVAFGVTSSNVINQLVFDRRIDHGSETGDKLIKDVRYLLVTDEDSLLTLFPSLWPIVRYQKKWRNFFRAWRNVQSFFHHERDIRQKRIDACKGEPKIHDFLDAYLIHRRTDPDNYTLEALDFVLLDLFLAGTDTISTTMTWAVACLVTCPEIQQKIHEEIISEIGDKEVSLSHRSGLPYTQAALFEVQRLATVTPIVPRQASRNASLLGHKIPKGTTMFLNLWSLHYDPSVWKDPTQFNPDRFLEDDGTLVKQPENLLPFSAGKRMCMGDQLAKMELFIFFTSMVQQMKFSLPPGRDAIPLDGLLQLVRSPKSFQILVSSWSD